MKDYKAINKKYVNIYTGESVDNYFESLGYGNFSDGKKVYLKHDDEDVIFDYKTNSEYVYNDLKFVICTRDNVNFDVLFNVSIDNNFDIMLRDLYVDGFVSAYRIGLNKVVEFRYLDNEFSLEIRG